MAPRDSLAQALEALPVESFEGVVFRVTSTSADPLAPSVNGGRWAPPGRRGNPTPVLYASLEKEGALAEVCSYLALLDPLPTVETLKLSALEVRSRSTLRLARSNLAALGVDLARYGERDYLRTQEIGAAAAKAGRDGLIAPSARWPCNNLMIFTDNLTKTDRLAIVTSEQVDWRAWARTHGFLRDVGV